VPWPYLLPFVVAGRSEDGDVNPQHWFAAVVHRFTGDDTSTLQPEEDVVDVLAGCQRQKRATFCTAGFVVLFEMPGVRREELVPSCLNLLDLEVALVVRCRGIDQRMF
jgi:hypothetical protein